MQEEDFKVQKVLQLLGQARLALLQLKQMRLQLTQ